MKSKTQQAAAAASDMSERSVRNWNKGPLPSEKKDRRRKSTRPDPFAGVWAEEVESLLEADVDRILAAPTVPRVDGRAASGQVRQVASADAAAAYEGLARAERS